MKSAPLELAFRLKPIPTHGYGDIVVVGPTWVDLQVLRPDGLPASGAELRVRDRDATLYTERWYKTDAQGRTRIEMVSDPMVLVVLYQNAIMTTEISERNAPKVLCRLSIGACPSRRLLFERRGYANNPQLMRMMNSNLPLKAGAHS